ncbi:unnamed protein product [Prunus brigantina]
MRVPNMVPVLATELYAIKVGLSFVLDASLVMLIVESDFLQAVEFVNSYEDCFALEGMFVDEIHRILKTSSNVIIQHVSRKANGVAHQVAQYSLRNPGLSFWMEVGSPWLMDCLKSNNSTLNVP